MLTKGLLKDSTSLKKITEVIENYFAELTVYVTIIRSKMNGNDYVQAKRVNIYIEN